MCAPDSVQSKLDKRNAGRSWNGLAKVFVAVPRRTKEEKVSQIDRITLTILNNKRYGYNKNMHAR